MSGFDENPFGEPSINDPFADPAVRKAASSIPKNQGIDDYNPFADQPSGGTTSNTQVRGASNPPMYGGTSTATQQPAMLQTSSQEAPPPAYTRTPQQNIPPSNSGMFSPTSQPPNEQWRRSQEMNNSPYYPRRNNWPPLPETCCVQPCFYQDIDVEIHTEFQKIVRQLYYLWIFHGFTLILNIIGGLAILLVYGDFDVFSLGILYLFLFTPFSFICWFRPAYNAFKNDSSFNFMVFFVIFFFQAVIQVVHSIGLPGSGTCGLILALTKFKSTPTDIIMGIFLLAIALCFIAAAAGDIILISKVHRIYRSTGASIMKAQEEFTSNFMRNEHVQNAASNVAQSAVRAQVNNMMQQPRY